MRTIYKFLLPGQGNNMTFMPLGARVLHVHEQDGYVALWAQLDSEAPED